MSVLGSDALGRLALGQIQQGGPTTTVLPVTAGSYIIAASDVPFTLTEPVTQSTVTIAGVVSSELVKEAVTAAAVAVSASAVSFKLMEAVSPAALSIASPVIGLMTSEPIASAPIAIQTFAVPLRPIVNVVPAAYIITGNAINTFEAEPVSAASIRISAPDVTLTRSGADFDLKYGGVGHFLYEHERARQLAAITRTIPPPIDRRTAPQFPPLARPYSAPPAPAVDLQAIQSQRMAAQAAAVQAQKKRRDEEALLLLAS